MKKLVEIPFNHELIEQEGIVVKFRSGETCEVFVSKKAINANALYPIISFEDTGSYNEHTINGKYDSGEDVLDYDLIMYKEVEVKEPIVIWVNVYENDTRLYPHLTEEDAREAFSASGRTVKFIEVIEEGE